MSDDSKILLGVPDTNGSSSYIGCNLGQSLTKKKPKAQTKHKNETPTMYNVMILDTILNYQKKKNQDKHLV